MVVRQWSRSAGDRFGDTLRWHTSTDMVKALAQLIAAAGLPSILPVAASNLAEIALGSLPEFVLDRFAAQFDIVVGNPPWTGFKGALGNALNARLTKLIARDSGEQGAAIRARYGSPDVAFLLLAAKIWAKPGGAIGFALHCCW